MPGIAEIAVGAAPIAGGALLGVAAGNLRAPDVRGAIKADMDLLDRLPADQTHRRSELQRVIGIRIDNLVNTVDKNFALRAAAASYSGNWRDFIVFVCAVFFTIVWWHVDHSKTNWLIMFLALIALTILTLINAIRGGRLALATLLQSRRAGRHLGG